MNTAAASVRPDAHEKTIDLRISRLRTAITHANTIHQAGADTAGHGPRLLVILIENKALIAAHAQTLITRTVHTVPTAEQDDTLLTQVRPVTLLIEEANIAIARLRHTLEVFG